MVEKANPDRPDKVADRIAGALVDMAYAKQDNPRIAVEVLLGHGECNIIAETSAKLSVRDVWNAVWRITGNDEITVRYREYQQDEHLAMFQSRRIGTTSSNAACTAYSTVKTRLTTTPSDYPRRTGRGRSHSPHGECGLK